MIGARLRSSGQIRRSVRKLATRRFSHGSRAGNRLGLRRPLSSLRPDLMLPITVQFLVAMLAYGLNERMARKADYLRDQSQVLRRRSGSRPARPGSLSLTSGDDVWPVAV
jgi:hypothetical protein